MVGPGWPFFSRARFLPLSDIHSSRLSHVLISEGCTIHGGIVIIPKHAVVPPGTVL